MLEVSEEGQKVVYDRLREGEGSARDKRRGEEVRGISGELPVMIAEHITPIGSLAKLLAGASN